MNKAILPLLIVLSIISFIAEGNFIQKKAVLKNKWFYFSISFFVLHIIGLLYTKNLPAGFFDLEQKMSLLIFPILFFSDENVDENFVFKTYKYFVVGCLCASFICLLNAGYTFYLTYSAETISYAGFSVIMHPSYFALYLSFSLAIVLFNNNLFSRTFLKIPIGIFLILIIILCASKSGIISALLVLIFKFFHLLFIKKKYGKSIVTFLISVVVLVAINLYFPSSVNRISSMFVSIKSKSKELDTTTSRVVIWKHTAHLIVENLLIGVGTGDVNDELQKKYSNASQNFLVTKKLNAHNQYLQTTAALGVVGFLILMVLCFTFLVFAIKLKNINAIIFMLLMLINMLFESILETQAGVIFFSFFMFMLFKNLLSNSNLIATK